MNNIRRARGIRARLPTGTVIGRKSGGSGAAEIMSVNDLAQQLSTIATQPTVGAGGTGFGTNGQVWATVAGAAAWTFTTLITSVGTIATGVWNGTKIALGFGGTGADLTGTGPGFLKQATLGANVTVAALVNADLPASGVVAGSYTLTNLTVNSQGIVTAASSGSGGAGSGTVTSVSMTVPAELAVAGSPITTAGTLAVTWADQADKTILSRITAGSGAPSFNTLTAVLDHDLGNTNDQIASRISGTWGARNLSDLLVAGSGVRLSGTSTVTINAAGSTTINAQPVWPAPRLGNVRADMWGDAGQFTNDGGIGSGSIGSGAIGNLTVQFTVPRSQGDIMIFDGIRWTQGNTINFNTSAPFSQTGGTTFLQVAGPDGTSAGYKAFGYGGRGQFTGVRADGTNAAKTGLVSDDIMFLVGGQGYTSAGAYSTQLVAQLQFNAAETFTGTAQGAYITARTIPKGATTNIEVARFWNQGCYFTGTNTNDSAAAGNYGEDTSSSVAVGSAVVLASATPANITSISLTAGNWMVYGTACFTAPGVVETDASGWISTVSATDPGAPNSGAYAAEFLDLNISEKAAMPVGMTNLKLAVTTTVYLSTLATNIGGGLSAYGFLGAWRIR